MRDIKSRGKRVSNGEWVYGWYQYVSKSYWKHRISNDQCIEVEVDPETIGQLTGIKDLYNRDIHDGDIIHASGHFPGVGWYDTGEHDYDFTAPVKWNKEKAAYTCKQYYLHELNRIVVVGNIFDRDDIKEAD